MSQSALNHAQRALMIVRVNLPHLAGLAALLRPCLSERVSTAGVFASGRLLLNPQWFSSLDISSAAFVLAHELMHLALRTHERQGEWDPRAVNVAHDYIINDILSYELDCEVPAGGLRYVGARERSLESLIQEASRDPNPGVWGNHALQTEALTSSLGKALLKAKVINEDRPRDAQEQSDVLSDALERSLFPNLTQARQASAIASVHKAGLESLSIQQLQRVLEEVNELRGYAAGSNVAVVEALRSGYRPPWEMALQRWLEAQNPSGRTYHRASRRGADRQDVVLPGRLREGRILHIVLDTSGSMVWAFPKVLGAIGEFCEAVLVEEVRIIECDVQVTKDEIVYASELASYSIMGMGGSDMSPAMLKLAADPEVEAAVVLTDGYIGYPQAPMPYEVLWAIVGRAGFAPPYGQVIHADIKPA